MIQNMIQSLLLEVSLESLFVISPAINQKINLLALRNLDQINFQRVERTQILIMPIHQLQKKLQSIM